VTVHPDLVVMLELVPADLAGGETIDWAAAEAALGTKLPSDYRSLLDTYGMGGIGELVILSPLPTDGARILGNCHIGGMRDEARWV